MVSQHTHAHHAVAWAVIILCACEWNAYGTTYYVDTTGGNDSNTGASPGTAWQSIAKVNSSMSGFAGGDSVLFKRGEIWATGTGAALRINKTGLADYLTFGSYGTGDKPIISHDPSLDGCGPITIVANDVDYIHIDNLDVRQTAGTGAAIGCARIGTDHFWVSDCNTTSVASNGVVVRYCDTFIIEDCNVVSCANSGIAIMGSATSKTTNGIIRNNILHGPGNDGITLHPDDDDYDVGANFLLENNVGWGFSEQAIDVGGGSNVTIRNCESYNNRDGMAIGAYVDTVLVDRCHVHDNSNLGITFGRTHNLTIRYSIIENSGHHSIGIGDTSGGSAACTDTAIYNCVIAHVSDGCPIIVYPGTDGLHVKNNIVVSTYGAPTEFVGYSNVTYASTNSDFDCNIWWQEGRSSFSLGLNSRFVDPQVIDLLNGDYHLQATSSAIDSGLDVGLTCDFDGCVVPQNLAPDAGAFEYAASQTYTLAVIANNGSVILDPDQAAYAQGQTVTLTAVADAGCSFSEWSGDASGTATSTTITMNGDKSVTASFAVNTYTLSVSASNGSVMKSPDQTTYTCGQTVTLTAAADAGYSFSGWSGDTSGTAASTTIAMDEDKSVTAGFTTSTYTLSISASNGSVTKSPDRTTYAYGQTVTLTATADMGYSFNGWSQDASGTSISTMITMNGDKSVTASFTVNLYTLSVSASNGSVTRSPNQTTYTYGQTVSLLATGASGYEFTGWSDDLTGVSNPATVVMTADMIVTAGFDLQSDDQEAPMLYGASPEADAIQTPLNALVVLHISDAGEGVDANTVSITANGESVYVGNVVSYTSSSGVCRRVGSEADYTYAYQPDEDFDYDVAVTVTVNATDLVGNVMTQQSYSFRTQMRSFGSNRCVSWGPTGVDKGAPATICDANGNIWVAYHAGNEGTRDVYLSERAFDSEYFGDPVQVTSNGLDQCNADIAVGAGGKFYLVWQDNRRGNWDIYASTSTDGVTWSQAVRVTDSNDDEINPAIAVDSRSPNRAYVVWEDNRAGNQDIYVASSSDGFVSTTVQAVTSNTEDQTDPRITVDASNTVYLVWTDARNGATDIYGASSESGPWSNVAVVEDPGNQFLPIVAAEPGGSMLHFAWVSDAAGDNDVCYRSSDGLPTTSLTGVDIIDDTSGTDQEAPAIAVVEGTGGPRVFVCWQDARNATNTPDLDIYAVEIRDGGETNLLVGDGGTGANQSEPAMAIDLAGRPYIVWTDDRNAKDQVYFASGTSVEPTPLDEQLISGSIGGAMGITPPTSEDDVSVAIPPGACPYDVTVSIARVRDLPTTSFLNALSYEFGPSGLQFDTPVTITIPYLVADYGSDPPQPYWYDTLAGALTQQDITNIECLSLSPTVGALRFETTHFTAYTLAAAEQNDGVVAVPSGSSGGCSLSPVAGGRQALEFFIPYVLLAGVITTIRLRDHTRNRTR